MNLRHQLKYIAMIVVTVITLMTLASLVTHIYAAPVLQTEQRMATSFIETAVLHIAYEVAGEDNGQPVMLLHGFPDDIRAWDAVVADLITKGFRTYVPYLRGFGETHFLDDATPRAGQNGALVQDVIDFADALELEQFILVGHGWGAQAAQGVAALYPERVSHLISFAPYSLTWGDYQEGPPNYAQIRALWYQNVLNRNCSD